MKLLFLFVVFATMTNCKKSTPTEKSATRGTAEAEQATRVFEGDDIFGRIEYPHVVYGVEMGDGNTDKCFRFERRNNELFDIKYNNCNLQATKAKDIGDVMGYWAEIPAMGPPSPYNPRNQFVYLIGQTEGSEFKYMGYMETMDEHDNPIGKYTLLSANGATPDASSDGYADKIAIMLAPTMGTNLRAEMDKSTGEFYMLGRKGEQLFCLKSATTSSENMEMLPIEPGDSNGIIADPTQRHYVFDPSQGSATQCSPIVRRLNINLDNSDPAPAAMARSLMPQMMEPAENFSVHKFKAQSRNQCLAYDTQYDKLDFKNCDSSAATEDVTWGIFWVGNSIASQIEYWIQIEDETTDSPMRLVGNEKTPNSRNYEPLVQQQQPGIYPSKFVYDTINNHLVVQMVSTADEDGSTIRTDYCIARDTNALTKLYRVTDEGCEKFEIVNANGNATN